MTQTGRIRTDGATLYHERRGSGPALLMISGGGGDAGYYSGVGDHLADAYTVLTYDRRGNSRSTVDDRSLPMTMAEQVADALAVLAHHDLESAVVFGGSGGALIGLDLTARSPAAVQGLIAHEPPVLSLLTDADRALFAEIEEVSRREGPLPAWVRFVSSIDRPQSPALVRSPFGRRLLAGAVRAGRAAFRYGPLPLREVGRFMGNSEYLMSREVGPFLTFEPDFAALKASGVPIVVGVGVESRPYYPARGGEAVAERLGVPVVEFPGLHAGYAEKPAEFAVTLREVLAGLREPAR
ncbi:alpha/beta hydrolase [Actinophytocola sp.]|uniref:alpha/beta fold hydrolase n=1 Tax=Actinophytocola sp. TaxID=1872138 RepID=UPI002D291DA4|nr:alpha/beta hydrolase [Actinophytocola sp.]HYQ67842.1 alpha/beta hydrolase [Actinophytocola sp.]